MNNEIPIKELTKALIKSGLGNKEALAAELGISLPTLIRWSTGNTVPRPEMEGKIRTLVNERHKQILSIQKPLFDLSDEQPEQLRDALKDTLVEMREILHRSARLSSRHEALDELGKLLFAHIMSIDEGGTGICEDIVNGNKNAATALREFVAKIFEKHLPSSLSHELQPEDFQLRLKNSEERFAEEVIDCFKQLASPSLIAQIRGAKGVDVLNDTFGQFLADSFSDEKELGQYLTPPEVVRFMVRLAVQSLDKADISILTNPQKCKEIGLILDPSCGVGSFLSEVLRVLQPEVQKRNEDDFLSRWIESMMTDVLVGIDKSERMIKLALTNLALYGVPAANLHLANALVRSGKDAEITKKINGKAKIILTNPPFGAEYKSLDLCQYKLASEWATRQPQSIDSELLFLERYIDWLAPDGILVTIVPDSVLTNKGLFSDLRNGLAENIQILSVTSLPSVTFGVAGTNTKTSILHLKKIPSQKKSRQKVYFSICEKIGFDVTTRGSQRHKITNGPSDLPAILQEVFCEKPAVIGQFVDLSSKEQRWDATFHASLSTAVKKKILECEEGAVRVRDVAVLVNDRVDPRRFGYSTFQYIEISDVSSHDCTVRAKAINTHATPSRARKLVKTGDVLVSTVRPERKAIGVVTKDLDGVVCSTGFAVLRCTEIEPMILARLLQSDFVNVQVLRNNMGIAYPVIEESCLLDIVLPIPKHRLAKLGDSAKRIQAARQEVASLEQGFQIQIGQLLAEWS